MADGRSRAFVNDQPVSVRTFGRSAASSKSTGSRTTVLWSTPLRIAGCSTPSVVFDGALSDVADCPWRLAVPGRPWPSTARIEKARAGGRLSSPCGGRARQARRRAGEETTLAERRSAMMQAEKMPSTSRRPDSVAGRIRPCRRSRPRSAGWSGAARRRRSSSSRRSRRSTRLSRRSTRPGAQLEAHGGGRFRPEDWNARGAPVRPARGEPEIRRAGRRAGRARRALCPGHRPSTTARAARDARSRPRRGEAAFDRAARSSPPPAEGASLDAAVNEELRAARSSSGPASPRRSRTIPTARRPGRDRSGRVLGAHQSRHAARAR